MNRFLTTTAVDVTGALGIDRVIHRCLVVARCGAVGVGVPTRWKAGDQEGG